MRRRWKDAALISATFFLTRAPALKFFPLFPVRVGRALLSVTLWSVAASAAMAQEAVPEGSAVAPVATPAVVASEPAPTPAPGVENSVVKIFATVRYPDPYKPWSKQSPREITGSGAVIAGKRILTNAHVVLYASQIQVQANQAGDKLAATVEAVAPGIDLAVLKLDDESFFEAHPALAVAKTLPEIKDAVLVYGYPQGGSSLSITKGIVSRIEFAPYNPPVSGLRIQIDAAINPGNSGGPAVNGDAMIGLAFSRLQGGAENIGYIIPGEEIELFLADIADGKYDGKPSIRGEFQTLENPALRAFLKLDKGVSGMIVHEPFEAFTPKREEDDQKKEEAKGPGHGGDPDDAFKEWDVITRVGDVPVDDQGMVKIGPNLRVGFAYLVQKQAHDGKLGVTVVRDGKEKLLTLAVPAKRPTLIPESDGGYPSYFVYGPMVFEDVDTLFVGGLTNGREGSTYTARLAYGGSPLLTRLGDQPRYPGERLVAVSSPFFPNKLAKGYSPAFGEVVKTVNGQEIKNLANLVETLRDLKDEFVTFEFQGHTGEALVFPRKEMTAATDDILTDNGVRSQGSPDVMAIWNKKGE